MSAESMLGETFAATEIERLRELGRYDEAINFLKVYQSLNENNIETRNIIEKQIVSISLEKARKLTEQGEHSERCSLFLDLFKRLECSELDQLKHKNMAALNLLNMDEAARSYMMFKEVASRRAELLKPTDRDLLCTQLNMASALGKLKFFKESLAIVEDILDKCRGEFGDDDPLTIRTQLTMAVDLLGMEAYLEAHELSKDAFERRKRILGPKDLETLVAQKCTALALVFLNRLTEAFDMFTQVFNWRKEKLGSNHPDTLKSQVTVGVMLVERAKYFEALRLLNQVHAKQKSVLGDTHPDTQSTLSCIEILKRKVGPKKFAKLQSLCEKNDNLTKLIALINLGDVRGVNDLLASGIDIIRVTGLKENTFLHFAVNKNNIHVIESLLGHANQKFTPCDLYQFINAQTTSAAGNTALHIAASNGSLGAIKVLLKYDATYGIKNKKGKTPRELANDPRVETFLRELEEAGQYQGH